MSTRAFLFCTAATLSLSVAPHGHAEPGSPEKPAGGAEDTGEDARRAIQVATFENGGGVTLGEIEDVLARQSPHLRKRYENPAELKDLVQKATRFALLAEEAERRGFGSHPAVVRSVKQNAVQALMQQDFDEDAHVASVSDEDVKAYYQEHLSEYQRPEMNRASHILVATLDEAKKLLEQAKDADLRGFRVLAREHSIDDTNKLRGGDLRYFDRKGITHPSGEAVVPEAVARAVDKLDEVGDVAKQPIEVEGGFSIVKLTGKRPALSRALPDVADSIRTRLARARRQEAIDQRVDELKAAHPPELHPERIEAIELDQGLRGQGIPHGFPHGKKPDGAGHPPTAPNSK